MAGWRRLDTPWYETRIVNCALCGKMIPRQAWVAGDAGEERVYCSPACERLYADYWLPRHGSTPRGAD
jgi:endogenous inhibitor of DNA gyrase (YacG/DUF329 family)